jgi:hypothetical protein
MDNATKQYLALLEGRILKLEYMFNQVNMMMQQAPTAHNCNQCGTWDPISTNYVCSLTDCCQGLNPEDDENP